MKKLLFSLLILSLLLMFTGCFHCVDGKGGIGSVDRKVKSFSKIELKIPADVEIGISSKTVLRIHSQKNISDLITTKVKGDKLVIDASKCLGDIEPIMINIFTDDLKEVEVEGSGTIKTKHPITVDKIKQ